MRDDIDRRDDVSVCVCVCGVDACSSEQPDNNNNKIDTSIHDPAMSINW